MKCDVALDLITDSLMDTVEGDTFIELQEHLSECTSCRGEARQQQEVWSELGRLRASVKRRPDRETSHDRLPAPQSRREWSPWAKAAAVVILLASGAFLGRLEVWNGAGAGQPVAITAGDPYLLLIRSDEPERRAPEAQLVSEYGDWASELAQRGALISAEKLTIDAGRWVQGESAAGDTDVISGFFLIRAANYDEAERVARASPHVAYGGTIELRAIENLGGSQ